MNRSTRYGLVFVSGFSGPFAVLADTVQYTASPGSYPSVASGLRQEFDTLSFPPLSEPALAYYQVQGSGPVTLTLRYLAETSS